MRWLPGGLAILLLCPGTGDGQAGFPFEDEVLRYSVTWPSGIGLGEGLMQAKRAPGGWAFEFALDASLPAFSVSDRYRSSATADLCSLEFEKQFVHGARKAQESVTFAQDKQSARRITAGGGSTDLSLPSCARDALAFLYYTRREMGQGRVPRPETIVYGGTYEIRLEYTGEQGVRRGSKVETSDRVVASLRGKASTASFEIYFARDAARTPLLIRVPFPLGTFSLELVR